MKKTTYELMEELKVSLLKETQDEYREYKKLNSSIQKLRYFLTGEEILKIKQTELPQYLIANLGISDVNLRIIGKEFGKLKQVNKTQEIEIQRLKEIENRYNLIYSNFK